MDEEELSEYRTIMVTRQLVTLSDEGHGLFDLSDDATLVGVHPFNETTVVVMFVEEAEMFDDDDEEELDLDA